MTSIGFFSSGTSTAPDLSAEACNALISPIVCSHGSKPSRAPLPTVIPEPAGRRVVDQAFDRKDVEIDLVAHLQRVAPVDKDEGAVAQHDGDTGRTAEAGQPFQPRRAVGDVFALMLVGARHDEAVQPVGRQPLAQQRHARLADAGSPAESKVWNIVGLLVLARP